MVLASIAPGLNRTEMAIYGYLTVAILEQSG
jgi:hypothetical protein